MARPVKWSRDLHSIRERASGSRTETWGRTDIEHLFEVGRATAQSLMKAIGELQPVGGAHFVERSAVLGFLDEMISAPNFEEAFRSRVREADPVPTSKPLRIALPNDLRSVLIRDLPAHIVLSSGRLEITADSAVSLLESLALLAQAMQNDLSQVQAIFEPHASPPHVEDGLKDLSKGMSIPLLSAIRTDQSVTKAARAGQFLIDYDPKCKAIEDYKRVADELIEILKD